jgi:hypothetical protein
MKFIVSGGVADLQNLEEQKVHEATPWG